MGQLLLTEKFVGECVNKWSLVVFVENCNLNGTRPQSPAENSEDEGSYTVENTRHQNCLRQDVLVENSTKVPDTADEWEKVASEFNNKRNYPCCIGALDGKHIAIQQPPNSGSEFFNNKHFSVLLLALVDANYKFLYVDVGAPAGDAGVFAGSSLKQALERNTLNIPPAKTEGIPSPVDYHIVGDDAFPLSKKIMKPYPQRNLDKAKRIFNYRLSRARRVVENAFGILANRFRVFLTTIKPSDEKVVTLILAACCLHNFMVETNKSAYVSAQEIENTDQHTITAGTWRNDPPLTGLSTSSVRNPAHTAKQHRKEVTEYFMSELGSVPWQDHMITH